MFEECKGVTEHFLGYLTSGRSLGSSSADRVPVNWMEALSHEKAWSLTYLERLPATSCHLYSSPSKAELRPSKEKRL